MRPTTRAASANTADDNAVDTGATVEKSQHKSSGSGKPVSKKKGKTAADKEQEDERAAQNQDELTGAAKKLDASSLTLDPPAQPLPKSILKKNVVFGPPPEPSTPKHSTFLVLPGTPKVEYIFEQERSVTFHIHSRDGPSQVQTVPGQKVYRKRTNGVDSSTFVIDTREGIKAVAKMSSPLKDRRGDVSRRVSDEAEVRIARGMKILGNEEITALKQDSAKYLVVKLGQDGTLSTHITWEHEELERPRHETATATLEGFQDPFIEDEVGPWPANMATKHGNEDTEAVAPSSETEFEEFHGFTTPTAPAAAIKEATHVGTATAPPQGRMPNDKETAAFLRARFKIPLIAKIPHSKVRMNNVVTRWRAVMKLRNALGAVEEGGAGWLQAGTLHQFKVGEREHGWEGHRFDEDAIALCVNHGTSTIRSDRALCEAAMDFPSLWEGEDVQRSLREKYGRLTMAAFKDKLKTLKAGHRGKGKRKQEEDDGGRGRKRRKVKAHKFSKAEQKEARRERTKAKGKARAASDELDLDSSGGERESSSGSGED